MRTCGSEGCSNAAVLTVRELGKGSPLSLCDLHADLWAAGWLVRGVLGALQDIENAAEHANRTTANGVGADNGAHHRM